MLTRAELTLWTSALRKNPEQQYEGNLANFDYTMFCCLGKACEVFGVERVKDGSYLNIYDSSRQSYESGVLPIQLKDKILHPGHADRTGKFSLLKMPDLIWNGHVYSSCTYANDGRADMPKDYKNTTFQTSPVPWRVIADHLDKYYPCADEVSNESSNEGEMK